MRFILIQEDRMHVQAHHSIEQLRQLAKAQKQARMRIRLQAVVLARQGETASRIAGTLGAARRAVQEWVARHNRHGMEALKDGAHRQAAEAGQGSSRTAQGASGGRGVGDRWSLHAAGGGCEEDPGTGVQRHLFAQRCLLAVASTGTQLPGAASASKLADPAAREAYAADFVEQARVAHPGKRVKVFFEDEARFGQQGTLTRTGARTGSRPASIRQTPYDYLWVLTAACPQSGQSIGWISPSLNAKVINLCLAQMSRELEPDVHAARVWDGGGFHTAGEGKVPGNITLLKLPPHSPELNRSRTRDITCEAIMGRTVPIAITTNCSTPRLKLGVLCVSTTT